MSLSQLQSVSFYGKVYMYINNITFPLNKLFLGEKLLPGCDLGKIYTEELTYLSIFYPDIM